MIDISLSTLGWLYHMAPVIPASRKVDVQIAAGIAVTDGIQEKSAWEKKKQKLEVDKIATPKGFKKNMFGVSRMLFVWYLLFTYYKHLIFSGVPPFWHLLN